MRRFYFRWRLLSLILFGFSTILSAGSQDPANASGTAAAERLDQAVAQLMQSGRAPAETAAWLTTIPVSELDSSAALQAFLLLSLPRSLSQQGELNGVLRSRLRILQQRFWQRSQLRLFANTEPYRVASDSAFIGAQLIFQNALQLLALTVFEVPGLASADNQKMLEILDRMFFHFGDWKQKGTAAALPHLFSRLEEYSGQIYALTGRLEKNGSYGGVSALLVAETDFICSFFAYHEETKR
jgi:hypothetical protein